MKMPSVELCEARVSRCTCVLEPHGSDVAHNCDPERSEVSKALAELLQVALYWRKMEEDLLSDAIAAGGSLPAIMNAAAADAQLRAAIDKYVTVAGIEL